MLGLKRGEVELEPHQTEWDIGAAEMCVMLKSILGDFIIDVQHVGSTSMKYICAKPILDIAVGIKTLEIPPEQEKNLENAGFRFSKQDIKDDLLYFYGKLDEGTITHHIHFTEYGSTVWTNYINYRDYMNSHNDRAKEYEELKLKLRISSGGDRKIYTHGKNTFIERMLKMAAVWKLIGTTVTVTVDHPIGSKHPTSDNIIYSLNYGFVNGLTGSDGEEQDAYIYGISEPVTEFTGTVIAVIYREDDNEDKLVVAPDGIRPTQNEITSAVSFQERYFRTKTDLVL